MHGLERFQIHLLNPPRTVHTNWSSGSHSTNDGGINNN